MKAEIKAVPFETIKNCNFKPEPHTVILNRDKPGSVWWILDDGNSVLCVICVVERKNEVHFARTFTPKEHRGNGYCTMMLSALADRVYRERKLTAHCLRASVNCYRRAGFQLQKIKQFKHGVQYYMIRRKGTDK